MTGVAMILFGLAVLVFTACAVAAMFREHESCRPGVWTRSVPPPPAVICAYCAKLIAGSLDSPVPISHGICAECYQLEMRRIAWERRAKDLIHNKGPADQPSGS